MSDESDRARSQGKPQHDFLVHVLNMPGWHKAVLLLGAILTVAGSVGVLIAKAHPEVAPQTPMQMTSAPDTTPPGARKMVDAQEGMSAAKPIMMPAKAMGFAALNPSYDFEAGGPDQ